MYKPVYTNKFKKNGDLCKRRGYDMELIKTVVGTLLDAKPLPPNCRPHKLKGAYAEYWECHVAPDWLLIYRYDKVKSEIIFEDTGTHSDLF